MAAKIPFTASSEINADNIDAAIREVQGQVKDASSGTIVNGSVTTEKLSAALLARVYGGRPWVSLNTPGSEQNKETDFPIGQIWLRPAFTVVNAAKDNWTASGCRVSHAGDRFTVTGDQTVATAAVTQVLANIGQDGDRVMALFGIQNKDDEITDLTVSLNSGEAQDTAAGVFESTLVGGALTVQISATWPSTSLAGGSFDVVNYAVVNLDQVLRQAADAEDMTDWAGFLNGLLPLSNYTSPEEVFIQTINGSWWPVGKQVYPVERGGTGLNIIGRGELLVGGDGNTMDKLAVPTEDDSFLLYSGGRPIWAAPGYETSVLRVKTGSYTGNGGARTLSLPVTPKLLFISTPSGVGTSQSYGSGGTVQDQPCTLGQGTQDNLRYAIKNEDDSTSYSNASIKLNGSTVTLSGPYFCNRSGITYNWVAIY